MIGIARSARDLSDVRREMFDLATPIPECGCWIWLRSEDNGGYGTLNFGGRNSKAHRISWRAFRGEIPQGMSVLHKCDIRLCVNPDHLFLGTQQDNIRDMVDKNRQRSGGKGRFGHNHPAHKLNIGQVKKIREMGSLRISQYVIAAEFGVAVMTVNRIIRGVSWRGI